MPFRLSLTREEFVFDCVFSRHTHADGDERVEQNGTCTTPGGETVDSASTTWTAEQRTAFTCSPGSAGIRS